MRDILKEFRATVIGMITVFCFLVTFCLCYYTVLYVTSNPAESELIAIIGTIIVVLFKLKDWLPKSARKQDLVNDLTPKGIDHTKSVYPETTDLKFEEEHAKNVSKRLKKVG